MSKINFSFPKWNIEELNGYKPKTTFWQDFSIADAFGIEAVKDTYNRAFKEWRNNVTYLTELALVLNHKIWQHYKTNLELAKVYNTAWCQVHNWAGENLEGEDFDYYFQIAE